MDLMRNHGEYSGAKMFIKYQWEHTPGTTGGNTGGRSEKHGVFVVVFFMVLPKNFVCVAVGLGF